MPYMAIISGLAAVAAYYKTKEVTWLYGFATLAVPLPFTIVTMVPTCNELESILEATH
jgi:hypothetical protein